MVQSSEYQLINKDINWTDKVNLERSGNETRFNNRFPTLPLNRIRRQREKESLKTTFVAVEEYPPLVRVTQLINKIQGSIH